MATDTAAEQVKATNGAGEKQAASKAKAKRGKKRLAKRRPAAKSKRARIVRASKPKPTRTRRQTAPARRAEILAIAQREGLTAVEVQKRFRVKPVTYYSWRKLAGVKGKRGRRPGVSLSTGSGDLTAQVRAGVQEKVRALLPNIVRDEVDRYLSAVLGSGAPRKRRKA